MGRSPCCSKEGLNRGAWTAQEDKILRDYISVHGQGKWRSLPQRAGLKRCGKSCRLRWLNYLRPDIKRGDISPDEEELIIRLHNLLGNRWSLIAGRLPGRTDNEIKNYWNTNLGKKVNITSTSSSQQPNGKNNMVEPKVTPSLISLSPSKSNLGSHSLLVHTKASKCSNKLLLVDPLHHPPMPLQNKSNEELEADATVSMLGHNEDHKIIMETNVFDNGNLLSFPKCDDDDHKELSTDLLLDFDTGDICFPDLLNSDFSDICDFGYNNSKDLLPFSDQLLGSSNENIKDITTQGNFCDETNVVMDSNFCEEW